LGGPNPREILAKSSRNPREILAKSSRTHEILWVGVPEGHGREKQELEKKPFVTVELFDNADPVVVS
jgi:hypothetical protein